MNAELEQDFPYTAGLKRLNLLDHGQFRFSTTDAADLLHFNETRRSKNSLLSQKLQDLELPDDTVRMVVRAIAHSPKMNYFDPHYFMNRMTVNQPDAEGFSLAQEFVYFWVAQSVGLIEAESDGFGHFAVNTDLRKDVIKLLNREYAASLRPNPVVAQEKKALVTRR